MSTANNARPYATRARSTAATAATAAAAAAAAKGRAPAAPASAPAPAAAPGKAALVAAAAAAASSSSSSTAACAVPKRALGDITNSQRFRLAAPAPSRLPQHQQRQKQHQQQQPPAKVRRVGHAKPASVASRRDDRAVDVDVDVGADADDDHRPPAPAARARDENESHISDLVLQSSSSAAPSPLTEDLVSLSSPLRKDPLYWPAVSQDRPTRQRRPSLLPCGVLDIDAGDANDPLAASQFARAIFRNFRAREARFMVPASYMDTQEDLSAKMRAILVDWLVDVHQRFKLRPETLHLTVNIIDRFLAVIPIRRRKLQLVGVTAMFIASKYEEIYGPAAADFVYITDKACGYDEVLHMEAVILNVLNFDVTVPSALAFLNRCLKAARAQSGLTELGFSAVDSSESLCTSPARTNASVDCSAASGAGSLPEDAEHFALYLLESTLQDSSMLEFYPSVRAATACFLGIKVFSSSSWTPTLRHYSGNLSEDDLVACETAMLRMLATEQLYQATNRLTAVKRKFAQAKFNGISRRAMLIDVRAVQGGTRGLLAAEKSPDSAGMDICYEDATGYQRR